MQSIAIPVSKVLAGKTVTGPVSARMTIDGREYINFFGAGYLALSGLPEIRAAVRSALDQGVPLAQQLPATHGALDPIFDRLEHAGAAACGTQACVYFASGYLIGMVAMASLERTIDVALLDESAHYSLQDAAKMRGLPTFTFAHCDAGSLREALKRHVRAKARPLLITDGVFPTTGRIPPLRDYAAALAPYGGRMLIDESHGFGVVGKNGRGAAEYHEVEDLSTIGATLSKAYCAHGAILACSEPTALRLRTIPPIGAACVGSPLSAAAATASLAYVNQHPELRKILRATTDYLRQRLRGIGLDVIDSPAPIVSFKSGSRADMQALQHRAFDRGIYIHYSTYIGAGTDGMIRCAVFRDHSQADIDALVDVLK